MTMIDVVGTDFGVVKLSAKTVAFLDGTNPRWREIHAKPCKFRGKASKRLRQAIKQVEDAAATTALIEWCAGGVLESY